MWNFIQFLLVDLPYYLYKTAEDFKWNGLIIFVVYQIGRISGMKIFRNYLESHFPKLKSADGDWKQWVNKNIHELNGAVFIPPRVYHGPALSRVCFRKNLATLSNLSQGAKARERRSRMKKVICDAGHGGVPGTKKADVGAVGTSGRYEKDFNLYVVRKVAEIFKHHPDIEILLTRDDDRFIELKDRVKVANKAKADIFISFHANSHQANSTGTETHYTTAQSKHLAEVMQKVQLLATGLKNRGIKVSNFHVTKNTKMPSCLLEPAYISNPVEDALIFDPVFMDRYAEAIALGICEYFGVEIDAQPVPEVPKNARYVPLILGERTFNGFILDGKSWIPAKEVMTALNFSQWSFKVKNIYLQDAPLETIIFKGTSYIKATDLKAHDLLLNVMFDPDSTNAKRVLLFQKEVLS